MACLNIHNKFDLLVIHIDKPWKRKLIHRIDVREFASTEEKYR